MITGPRCPRWSSFAQLVRVNCHRVSAGCHPWCVDHAARLVSADGSSLAGMSRSGDLEVWLDGQWRRVCADGFTLAAARIACGMAGLPASDAAVSESGAAFSHREPLRGTDYAVYNPMCMHGDAECSFQPSNAGCMTGSVAVTCGSNRT